MGATNLSLWWKCYPGEALIEQISSTDHYEAGMWYAAKTFKVLVSPKLAASSGVDQWGNPYPEGGFDYDYRLDAGPKIFDPDKPGQYVPIPIVDTAKGLQLVDGSPRLLNGAGGLLTAGAGGLPPLPDQQVGRVRSIEPHPGRLTEMPYNAITDDLGRQLLSGAAERLSDDRGQSQEPGNFPVPVPVGHVVPISVLHGDAYSIDEAPGGALLLGEVAGESEWYTDANRLYFPESAIGQKFRVSLSTAVVAGGGTGSWFSVLMGGAIDLDPWWESAAVRSLINAAVPAGGSWGGDWMTILYGNAIVQITDSSSSVFFQAARYPGTSVYGQLRYLMLTPVPGDWPSI